MEYNEVSGNLVTLAKEGRFDVIAHGCNCFCRMKRGLAPALAEAFKCDSFPLERTKEYSVNEYGDTTYYETGNEGNINKLGQIDYEQVTFNTRTGNKIAAYTLPKPDFLLTFIVVNAYTQYHWDTSTKPFDYDAFKLCMRKMNKIFKGKHIGLPQIGAHLAGGDWEKIKPIIQKELKDCKVTVVIWDGK